MIVNREGMKQIEASSGFTTLKLMEKAGTELARALAEVIEPGKNILILCGHGNNGGDGFVIARRLKGRSCRVMLMDGEPVTKAAKTNFKKLKPEQVAPLSSLKRELKKTDAVVDCIYGFGFRMPLSSAMKKAFKIVNDAAKPVYAVDINSGCECDSGRCDPDALHSDITFALDCYKPFHMLAKEHGMFKTCRKLSMELPHSSSSPYIEMNEEAFFANFTGRGVKAYKGEEGKILLIGGSYGMAGALSLNIMGAETVGASYINVALPGEIYPLVAVGFMRAVYHPFGEKDMAETVKPLVHQADAIAFGSGAVNIPNKQYLLDTILQDSKVPVVLDAEALRLMKQNTYLLKFVREPVIMTPHIGEFADLLNKPREEVYEHRIAYAEKFAREHKVHVVLKGANTIVVSPQGQVYINQSGSQALARAGSGDLLTGMITAMLVKQKDVFKAICMAVWLHGYLAELGLARHSIEAFPLTCYPELMDELYKKHGL